jgi:hypothetical protein
VPPRFPSCVQSFPAFLGPTQLCPLDVAAAQELPPDTFVDLRLVIANCCVRGACSYPSDRLVVVGTCDSFQSTEFQNLVLHECAHVIGGVCDEYWVCAQWEGETFSNFGTVDEVRSGSLRWGDLLPDIPPRHLFGLPGCVNNGRDHNRNLFNTSTTDDTLGAGLSASTKGAFWGCQFVAEDFASNEENCCAFDWSQMVSDPAGFPYFRPSPDCKMRYLDSEFCFVCSQAVGYWLSHPVLLAYPAAFAP